MIQSQMKRSGIKSPSSLDQMSASPSPSAKKARKGTRSCLQCRHRKIRCDWPSDDAAACRSCLTRAIPCEIQTHMLSASEIVARSSRARIGDLESQVTQLWANVSDLQAKVGCAPAAAAATSQAPAASHTHDTHDTPDSADSDNDSSSAISGSGLPPTSPPTHIMQLFDNRVLAVDANAAANAARPSENAPLSPHKSHSSRRSALRGLMPAREDMEAITASASSWLSLYNALCPMINPISSSREMLTQYENLQDPDADPFALAALLLSVAITVQQAPNDTSGHASKSIKDPASFIRLVSDTVERHIISDETLSGSLEGVKTSLLFLRLQLGRAKVRKMWLLSRRIIALAEMVGLPRASMALTSYHEWLAGLSTRDYSDVSPAVLEDWKQKAEVWESACAVDRMSAMMWSLPLATINYPLSRRPIIDQRGHVNPQSYLYSLADVASRVHELDNIYTSGRPLTDLLEAVMVADHELRSLASRTPPNWMNLNWSGVLIDTVLQYWHHYLTIRTHLQLALKSDENQRFAFSYSTCLEACQQLTRRYISIRPSLPAGFFANRVIDLQVFTAIIFLLLASWRASTGADGSPQPIDIGAMSSAVEHATGMLEFAAGRVGGDFARQAVEAVLSLRSLLRQPRSFENQKMTMSLPLIGKIHVFRKSQGNDSNPQQPSPATIQAQGPGQPAMSHYGSNPVAPAMSDDLSGFMGADSFSYSMEIPENNPLLTDDALANEQWFTYTPVENIH